MGYEQHIENARLGGLVATHLRRPIVAPRRDDGELLR
jgi:hypothetical protein